MAVIKQRIRRIESFLSLCDQSSTKPPPRRLQTVQDLIDLLEEQTEAVRAAPWASPLDKARAIAYPVPATVRRSAPDVLELGLKFREAAALEQRLAAVEARLAGTASMAEDQSAKAGSAGNEPSSN
jgi:hypothetical protein